jgi:acyl-CoA reductase-like NAD-dependent aldehyde dehydrogenase
MDAADRGKLMFDLADLIEQHAEELAVLESYNCGKTITDSRGDLAGVVSTIRYYAGWADKIEGKVVPVRGSFLSTRSVSRWAWSARSSPGTFRCSCSRGNGDLRSPVETPS